MGARNVVLDPVMAASSGERLLRADALDALRKLIPRARVVTPNLPEAAALLGVPASAGRERDAARRGRSCSTLGAARRADQRRPWRRRRTASISWSRPMARTRFSRAARSRPENTHGTGCTFASAIAAGLAKGLPLGEAVREAKTYIGAAIAAADRLDVGSGRGPLHHFFKWW